MSSSPPPSSASPSSTPSFSSSSPPASAPAFGSSIPPAFPSSANRHPFPFVSEHNTDSSQFDCSVFFQVSYFGYPTDESHASPSFRVEDLDFPFDAKPSPSSTNSSSAISISAIEKFLHFKL